MTIACPGCQTELDLTSDVCPICLRRRSREEIFRGVREQREAAQRARRRPRIIALSCLLALLAAYGTYSAYEAGLLNGLTTMGRARPGQSSGPEGISSGEPSVEGQAAKRPAAYTLSRPAPPGFDPKYWSLRGMAYDLMDLKPIAGVRIAFTDKESGKTHAARTDAKGAYNLLLPRIAEGGYSPSVSHKEYPERFLEEEDLPYRNRSLSRRQEAAQLLSATEILHVPLLPDKQEHEIRYDVILYRPR